MLPMSLVAALERGAVQRGEADDLRDGEARLRQQLDIALIAEPRDGVGVAGGIAADHERAAGGDEARARTPSPFAAAYG